MLRYLTVWLELLAVAVINGGLSDLTYGKLVPELLALQFSCFSSIILFGVVFYQYVRRWLPISTRQTVNIGIFWMMLTVVFEFLFFHYVAGHTWPELLENYNMHIGRMWPLILLLVAFGPYVLYLYFNKRL